MNRIDPGEIARLKAQIPLSELIGRDVTWDKKKSNARKRDFWACCVFHGERSPSFHVDDGKGFYHCFGCGASGDHIAWLTDFKRLSFSEAVRELGGETIELSEEQKQDRHQQTLRVQADRERQRLQEERDRARKAMTAAGIWGQCKPIPGTLAERYLYLRGIDPPPMGWPDVIGFHAGLEWELGSVWDGDRKITPGPIFPCLVGRVQDISETTIAVWRIFIGPEGRKAPVENPKLGLGPARGGAIRIGGIGPVIGVAEGMETAFGAWALIGFKYPVWSTMSTSGMMEVELPIAVSKVKIFPDGDRPLTKKDGEYLPAEFGAGMKAAKSLWDRCLEMDVECKIQPEPGIGSDYLDIWLSARNIYETNQSD